MLSRVNQARFWTSCSFLWLLAPNSTPLKRRISNESQLLIFHHNPLPIQLNCLADYKLIAKFIEWEISVLAATKFTPSSTKFDHANRLLEALHWWARTGRIQTLSEMSFQIDIHRVEMRPLYQEIVNSA